MSRHAQSATALQNRTSPEPTHDGPEWGAALLREVKPEQPMATVEEGRDLPLVVLIFGSAIAMYAAAGFGIYMALQALVL